MSELPPDPRCDPSAVPPAKSRSRIALKTLPARAEGDHERVLPKLLAIQGESCFQNCDCAFGLICRQGVCEADW